MTITVLSGKGGTGKTAVSTALPLLLENSVYIDMDAEEPDGELILKPEIYSVEKFTVSVPFIDEDKCTYCGKCSECCNFGALFVSEKNKTHLLFNDLCHNCGTCSFVCPVNGAISERQREKGEIRRGQMNSTNTFIGLKMNVGEASSVSLLAYMNKYVQKEYEDRFVIIDGPPGTACPAVESVKNADYAVVVAEPTVFGLSNLKIVAEMLRSMKKIFGIVVNKYEETQNIIHAYAVEENIKILGEIPFSIYFAKEYSNGKNLVDAGYKKEVEYILNNIKKEVDCCFAPLENER